VLSLSLPLRAYIEAWEKGEGGRVGSLVVRVGEVG